MPLTEPYSGQSRKLVLAFDVGTTSSVVTYSILEPGVVPEVRVVNQYPGQEGMTGGGDPKVPSLLYYSNDGKLYAAGAEASQAEDDMEHQGRGAEFILVRWFKLRLRPASMQMDMTSALNSSTVKPAVDMWGDFLGYLYQCARNFITQVHGQEILSDFERPEIILTHPNGWGGTEQKILRRAAIMGGLITAVPDDYDRLHFVSEGEASFHYCVVSGAISSYISRIGSGLLVIDAGGGTVDFSAYKFTGTSPLAAEEIVASDCIFEGSTFVNMRAEKFLREKLHDSHFGDDETLKQALASFESSAKPTFKESTTFTYIRIGSSRDTDASLNITRGRLLISAAEMGSFLEPSVTAIENVMKKQLAKARTPVSTIFLVGDFSRSPFLVSRLRAVAGSMNLQLFCPCTSDPSKAVAVGCMASYLQQFITARVAGCTYGTICSRLYKSFDPQHRRRLTNVRPTPSRRSVCLNAYTAILPKETLISEDQKYERAFIMERRRPSRLNTISVDIVTYNGPEMDGPKWTDEEPNLFCNLCVVMADTSSVPKTPYLRPGGVYYRIDLKLIFSIGPTGLQARLAWTDKGIEKEGPATIVHG